MNTDSDRLAGVFKALSCGSSIRIIKELRIQPRYVTELAGELNMSQENVSHRLKKLLDVGIVTYAEQRQEGWTRHCFSLVPDALVPVVEELFTPAKRQERPRRQSKQKQIA